MKATGQLIRELRTQKGLTQEDIAERTGISVRTIQRIEAARVEPRAYTIQAIADALEVRFEELHDDGTENSSSPGIRSTRYWLTLLHLSGLFLLFLPPLIVWLWKRNQIEEVNEHGIDVLNFQLTMLVFFMCAGILAFTFVTIPLLVIGGIFASVVIILNTIRVLNDQSYTYPLVISILRLRSPQEIAEGGL